MQNQVEKFLARLKDSHPDMEILYTTGGCFHLYLILRIFWPHAIPWYDYREGHVYTEIDGCYYDIRGKRLIRGEQWQRMDQNWPKHYPPHRWKPRYRIYDEFKQTCIDHDYDI